MGSFYGQDVVTGDVIHSGDPVVAFAISPGEGHPFAVTPGEGHAFDDIKSGVALLPTGRFLLESLPLHGVYDGHFGLEINRENEMAVQLLLKMTGCRDWEDFSERGLKPSEGVRLFGSAETYDSKYTLTEEQRTRHYGMTMMHADTFVHLMSQPMTDEYSRPTTARRELEKMASLQARYQQARADLPSTAVDIFSDAQMNLIQLHQACQMGKQFTVQKEDGSMTRAPKLCQALDYDVYGPDFLAATRFFGLSNFHEEDSQREKYVGALHMKGTPWPREDASEFLSQLWTVQACMDAMKRVVAEIRPMMAVSEGTPEDALQAMRLNGIEKGLVRQFARLARDDEREPVEAMEFLEQSLGEIEGMVERTRTQARAHLARNAIPTSSLRPHL